MADPATNNHAASVVNGILKKVIEGTSVDAIEALVIADVPWLGFPVIKQVFEFILNKVAALIYVRAANAATKIVVDIQVNGEESVVLSSFQNLQMAIASGDADAIKKASDNLDEAYGSLIHSDGIAVP